VTHPNRPCGTVDQDISSESVHATDPQLPDRELVRETLLGSREAFGLLAVRYARIVRAACIARTGMHQDLDDMVQEVFLRAYKGLGRLQSAESFGSYVHRIAVNLCVDRLRRRDRKALSLDEIELDPTEEVVDTDPHDRLARLRRIVGSLPESLREVVLLFYFQEMSYAQMASVLSITEAAVNQRLNRARQKLRTAFGLRPGTNGDDNGGPV
jgi:RNA polymerase sigma-70 factor (ECF subfamily)